MAAVGDRVKIITKKETLEGVLMPTFDKKVVLLKLDTGYNLGFPKNEVERIKVITKWKKTKGREVKEESEKKAGFPAARKGLATIAILHTGGTIASKVDYRTGGVAAEFSPEELTSLFPELTDIANIKSELIAQMWSDDLRFKHFSLIAKAVEKQVKAGIDGIIIGMGTDNLAVAAAALSFVIESSPIPVIFVGAQRSSDRGSSDAGMNLICAAEFMVKSDFAGVAICMHRSAEDDNCAILPGAKTYKLHSSRRDAFKAVNSEPLAWVNYRTREVQMNSRDYPRRADYLILKPKMEEKVGLLKIHVNMFPEQFEFFKGYKGLVIEGTGLGHTPGQAPNPEANIHKKIYPAIKKLVESGCIIVMTTQCLFGSVDLQVYDKGRDLLNLGIIPGKDMLANTALVKLSWLLGNYLPKEAKELIGRNLRGEINERLSYREEFLE